MGSTPSRLVLPARVRSSVSFVAERPWASAAAALVGYSVVAFLFFGLPLLIESGSQYVGVLDDPQIPIWSFAWWPHAILHGENPFVTHVVWAPHGVNLAWANTLPPLALVLAPLTWTVGPVAAYNVAAVLLPAVSAWTAFLLCRHVTGRFRPSLFGGYLFGFSSYVLGHVSGQPQLTGVFLIPLVALLLLRYVEGSLDGRGLALRLGPVLGLQFYLSLEVAFTLAVALAGALVLAFAFVPEKRSRIVSSLRPLVAASGLGALIAAPLLYYALSDLRRAGFQRPSDFVSDLANVVLPTHVEAWGAGWASSIAKHFAANVTEQGAFIGVPLLIILVLFAWERRRSSSGRFLVACVLLAAYASLGPRLAIAGHRTLPLPTVFGHETVDVPGRGPKHIPVFDNTLPVRFALYTSLAVAVAAALWTAGRRRGLLGWLLPVLAVLLLVPNPVAWSTTYTIPSFFTDARYRACLPPGANVLPEPPGGGGQAMLWQVADDFRFRMAGGRLQTSPPSAFLHPSSIAQISVGYDPVPNQPKLLRAYARRYGVSHVIVDERQADLWAPALDRIATRHEVGGVLLYSLAGPLDPGCPAS